MQGIAITDHAGRRILSTHFASPLIASLAIDIVTANPTQSVSWVPSLLQDDYSRSRSDGNDEEEEEEVGEKDGWNETKAGGGGGGGFAVCMIERRGLRYIVPVLGDLDPIIPLTFLSSLHQLLESYIQGPATESSLKDNFDIVLELFHESLSPSSRLPNQTGESQLRELVVPPSQLLQKVVSAAGLTIPSSTGANALLASPLPWRKQGIKYSSNEIYFDLLETISLLLSPSSPSSSSKPRLLSGTLSGRITCRSRLSGMPDLNLTFVDPSLLSEGLGGGGGGGGKEKGGGRDNEVDGVSFHECVRYGRWKKDKIVSFVPPDGPFPLLSYSLPLLSSPHSLTLLPLTLLPYLTSGPSGGTFSILLTSLSPPSRPLTNLRVTIRLPRGAGGVQGTTTGGRWPMEGEKRGERGAGRWEVGEGGGEGVTLVWEVDRLCSTDRPAKFDGQWNSTSPHPLPLPTSISLTFSSPESNFSGVRIQGVQLAPMVGGENYSVFKGVKLQGEGEVEVRC